MKLKRGKYPDRTELVLLAAFAVLAGLAACQINEVECDAECQDNWLDGDKLNDSSYGDHPLDTAHPYRISRRPDTLPPAVKDTLPVIIAAHGYTASTFEWLEFRQHIGDTAGGAPSVLVSLVLLGGHGGNIGEFQESDWKDWGAPILAEYDTLVKLGYKNISLAGTSTGCPLILDLISRGRFKAQPPNQVFLIDPIISPSAKILSLIGLVGPILGNSPEKGTEAEQPHWYTNRPAETLNELYTLTNLIKNRLESGITLPTGTRAKVWKAKKDGLADPIGALLLYKGLKTSVGGRIDVEMVDTRKHVFTRLAGRNGNSDADYGLQKKVFDEMSARARLPE
jgi:carboxylesterase